MTRLLLPAETFRDMGSGLIGWGVTGLFIGEFDGRPLIAGGLFWLVALTLLAVRVFRTPAPDGGATEGE